MDYPVANDEYHSAKKKKKHKIRDFQQNESLSKGGSKVEDTEKKDWKVESCANREAENNVNGVEHADGEDTKSSRKRKTDLENCQNGASFCNKKGSSNEEQSNAESKDERKKKKKKKNQDKQAMNEQNMASEDGFVVDAQAHNSSNKKDGKIQDLQISVSGKDAQGEKFRPLQSFSEVRAPMEVMKCCNNFVKPSPIQAHAWPFLLDGRDLIGIAATGSGKTLAFGVPALVHVLNRNNKASNQNHPACLVLSPTRELAQQIAEVLVDAGNSCGVRTACLYGGTSKKPQYHALKMGVDIIVATPGRLQDLVQEGRCSLHNVSFVVLDEADRMLDLGFEEAVRALINQIKKSRQTIMFSATWPAAVDRLAEEYMRKDPIKVTVGSQDLAANHAVTQVVEVIDSSLRDARLIELLKEYHKSGRNRVLVFVLYKKEAVRVESMLQRRGWNALAVHGDKGQSDRNKAVTAFKDGSCPLLIATDVAARGLDIPDVEYVINYSFPLTTEDYVHRIGRTGRAGKSGFAHTFFTHTDKARAGELVNVLKEAGQVVPSELLKFGTSVKKKESKLYGAHFKDIAVDAPKATKITFESDEE
ncbi:hypothetical protein KP509_34G038200 [Ceratopteris richardii]|nr:hypothetical protein KP509_34G038200 [Ceratopteris richardii]